MTSSQPYNWKLDTKTYVPTIENYQLDKLDKEMMIACILTYRVWGPHKGKANFSTWNDLLGEDGTANGLHLKKGWVYAGTNGSRFSHASYINAAYLAETDDYIVLAFRGTAVVRFDGLSASLKDWLTVDICADPVLDMKNFAGKVHKGWRKVFLNMLELQGRNKGQEPDPNSVNLFEDVRRIMADPANAHKKLYITGYSKGGALAPLATMYFHRIGGIDAKRIKTYLFEPPRVGETDFVAAYNQIFTNQDKSNGEFQTKRFMYSDDMVPHLPTLRAQAKNLKEVKGLFAEAKVPFKLEYMAWDYAPVGDLFYINLDHQIDVYRNHNKHYEAVKLELEHHTYRIFNKRRKVSGGTVKTFLRTLAVFHIPLHKTEGKNEDNLWPSEKYTGTWTAFGKPEDYPLWPL